MASLLRQVHYGYDWKLNDFQPAAVSCFKLTAKEFCLAAVHILSPGDPLRHRRQVATPTRRICVDHKRSVGRAGKVTQTVGARRSWLPERSISIGK